MAAVTLGEKVHRLPHDPVPLFQFNTDPRAYYNPMGCGAFSTAMALSFYDPRRFGNYDAPRAIFNEMIKVPFLGGTFESQNAAIARRYGFLASPYDRGTVTELGACINSGAPTIMLVNPGIFGIGQHDVLLVGYSTDTQGKYVHLFVNNPAIQNPTVAAPPGLAYPGNEVYQIGDLPKKWTGCFTPFFAAAEAFAQWRTVTHRA